MKKLIFTILSIILLSNCSDDNFNKKVTVNKKFGYIVTSGVTNGMIKTSYSINSIDGHDYIIVGNNGIIHSMSCPCMLKNNSK